MPRCIFFYVQSPCVTRPCLNRAPCVPDYRRNDYHCECNSGYSGENCENGKWSLLFTCPNSSNLIEPVSYLNQLVRLTQEERSYSWRPSVIIQRKPEFWPKIKRGSSCNWLLENSSTTRSGKLSATENVPNYNAESSVRPMKFQCEKISGRKASLGIL